MFDVIDYFFNFIVGFPYFSSTTLIIYHFMSVHGIFRFIKIWRVVCSAALSGYRLLYFLQCLKQLLHYFIFERKCTLVCMLLMFCFFCVYRCGVSYDPEAFWLMSSSTFSMMEASVVKLGIFEIVVIPSFGNSASVLLIRVIDIPHRGL